VQSANQNHLITEEDSRYEHLGNDQLAAQISKSLKIPKCNQNPYIEEEQTTQWPEEKVQKDKQHKMDKQRINEQWADLIGDGYPGRV
jgi:hypothetical protein